MAAQASHGTASRAGARSGSCLFAALDREIARSEAGLPADLVLHAGDGSLSSDSLAARLSRLLRGVAGCWPAPAGLAASLALGAPAALTAICAVLCLPALAMLAVIAWQIPALRAVARGSREAAQARADLAVLRLRCQKRSAGWN